MGDIYAPSSCKSTNLYKLHVGGAGEKSKSLKLSIYTTENVVHIYIGGPSKYCIYATLHTPNSIYVQRGLHDSSIGTIEHIYYNKSCSLEHNFVRGIDTNMILRLLITYIKQHYSYVKSLNFYDASSRTCDNGETVSLAAMTYLYSGSTWYEKNFNAYLSLTNARKFTQIEDQYNLQKRQYSWQLFSELYLKGALPLPEHSLQTLFDKARTWGEFFQPCYELLGISEFCKFVSPWLTLFIRQVMRHEFISLPYLFDVDDFTDIIYTRSPYVSTGGRFTRKQSRKRPKDER